MDRHEELYAYVAYAQFLLQHGKYALEKLAPQPNDFPSIPIWIQQERHAQRLEKISSVLSSLKQLELGLREKPSTSSLK